MARILCTGDRNWDNIAIVRAVLVSVTKDSIIMQGMCRGADLQVREIALAMGINVEDYPADWSIGREAGPIRNREMLDRRPDFVIAFHNNFAESKGTKDCVKEALRRKIPVYLISYTDCRQIFSLDS